jgi:hypothetical protein
MTDHPITPPPELVQQWAISSPIQHSDELWVYELFIARQAARWGADQELEACCAWVSDDLAYDVADRLRAARRPKPPSLKEQALEVVTGLEKRWDLQCDLTLLRRALEQLDD